MTDRNELVAAFKAAWHEADKRGEIGHRVEAGISAVLASIGTYPHQSGDFTVIGPECFTDAGATVIAYKGENYYPRETATRG